MRAHRTDGVSLFFGLLFLALAAWWLLAQLLDLALPATGWFLAGGLILVGLFGLLGALRAGRQTTAAAPVTAPSAPGDPTSGPPVSGAGNGPVTGPPAPGDRRD